MAMKRRSGRRSHLPIKKRAINQQKAVSPIDLPRELIARIFNFLEVKDVFRTCNLVSKSWKSLINSEWFFEFFLRRELTDHRVNVFLKKVPDGIAKFRQLLLNNKLLHAGRFRLRKLATRGFDAIDPKNNAESIEEFVKKLTDIGSAEAWHFPSYCYHPECSHCHTAWWVINFGAFFPDLTQVVELLQMPIVLSSSMFHGYANHGRPCKVAFGDKNLTLLKVENLNTCQNEIVLSEVPSMTRFLVLGPVCGSFSVRLALPSLVKSSI